MQIDLLRQSSFAGQLNDARDLRLQGAGCSLELLAQHAAEFDVIHGHTDRLHLPLLSRLEVPFVTTPHGRQDAED